MSTDKLVCNGDAIDYEKFHDQIKETIKELEGKEKYSEAYDCYCKLWFFELNELDHYQDIYSWIGAVLEEDMCFFPSDYGRYFNQRIRNKYRSTLGLENNKKYYDYLLSCFKKELKSFPVNWLTPEECVELFKIYDISEDIVTDEDYDRLYDILYKAQYRLNINKTELCLPPKELDLYKALTSYPPNFSDAELAIKSGANVNWRHEYGNGVTFISVYYDVFEYYRNKYLCSNIDQMYSDECDADCKKCRYGSKIAKGKDYMSDIYNFFQKHDIDEIEIEYGTTF